ncbi:hypothetical protein HIM_00375 [Hirsutella minnesotensis 3608]|nr:hypothetical protein HIM_00375 [Hirsutella minnesotensis 3608]
MPKPKVSVWTQMLCRVNENEWQTNPQQRVAFVRAPDLIVFIVKHPPATSSCTSSECRNKKRRPNLLESLILAEIKNPHSTSLRARECDAARKRTLLESLSS